MKNINQFIIEKFKLNSKNIKNQYSCKPKTRDELKKIISKRITNQKLNYKNKEEVLNLNDIDTSDVNSFNHLFTNLNPLKIDISEWDTSNVENMRGMFDGCEYLQSTGDLGNWDVSNVTNMSFMFNDCRNLTNIGDLSSWEINDTEMKYAFQNCKKLKSIGFIKHWRPKEANWEIFPLCSIKIKPVSRV